MSIPEKFKARFDNMLDAALEGGIALVECRQRVGGPNKYVISIVVNDANGDYELIPIAAMLNPDSEEIDNLIPPGEGEGVIEEAYDSPA